MLAKKTGWWHQLTARFKLSMLILFVLFIGALSYVLLPKPELRHYQSYSSAVYDRNGQLLRLSLAKDQRYRLYTALEDVSPLLQEATVLYEDQGFYEHSGVDYPALIRAFWQTYVLRERRIGASTIVMQVARLRWQIESNSITGKAEQIFRALQLARHYSKEELLEAYLNFAPYGGNIEGIGAASLIYFNKSASQLSLPEAITLALIPQNPNKRNPSKPSGQQALSEAKKILFARWQEAHPEEPSNILDMPLRVRASKDLPFDAPHYVDWVMQKKSITQKSRSQSTLVTSLNLPLQHRVEKQLEAYINQKKVLGFSNASVLVLNTKSMQIEAMIGSADFSDINIQGQVNGTLAKRSPGSTLKPFIYALAIDAGLIHPLTLLKDLPKRYSAFTPENFGKGFVGPISASEALIRSRNVPAVELQSRLNQQQESKASQSTANSNVFTLYQMLQAANVSQLRSEDFYGLALALGGVELSMLELVSLYAAISNEGIYKSVDLGGVSVNWVSGPESEKRLFSAESAYLIRQMLSQNTRPDNRIPSYTMANAPSELDAIAWKTGTSWAFRDAWAIGIAGDYVVAVWIGHFNGEGNNAFIGRTAAGPLLFGIVDALRAIQPASKQSETEGPLPAHLPAHLNLKHVKICKPTGDLYEVGCPEPVLSAFIPGVSPISSSNIYRKVLVDKVTGLLRCDRDHIKGTEELVAFWPKSFLELYASAGIVLETPPSYMPGCDMNFYEQVNASIDIYSPQEDLSYIVNSTLSDAAEIPLQANADGAASRLYWFANKELIGVQELQNRHHSNILTWNARPGNYEVLVIDDLGNSASKQLTVLAGK
jgi:penicillin-binding protein 1C